MSKNLPTHQEYTFYPVAQGNIFKIYHILGHKTNLRKLRRNEIIHFLQYKNIYIKQKTHP